MKEFTKLAPNDPSDLPCYYANPKLWAVFLQIEDLPEYIIAYKPLYNKPIFTEKDVVRQIDTYFGFPEKHHKVVSGRKSDSPIGNGIKSSQDAG
jgi:hypothetical protein